MIWFALNHSVLPLSSYKKFAMAVLSDFLHIISVSNFVVLLLVCRQIVRLKRAIVVSYCLLQGVNDMHICFYVEYRSIREFFDLWLVLANMQT
jgi:hypothetical protein